MINFKEPPQPPVFPQPCSLWKQLRSPSKLKCRIAGRREELQIQGRPLRTEGEGPRMVLTLA